jgi:chromosome segregation ATPase
MLHDKVDRRLVSHSPYLHKHLFASHGAKGERGMNMSDETLRSDEMDSFAELADLVRQAKEADVDIDADNDNEAEQDTEQEQDETENESNETETSEVQDTEDDSEPDTKSQTAEENRRYAEARRQQQIEQRVQEELDKRMQELPEVRTARLLSEMYGMPVDQVYKQLEEARLQQEAQHRNIPVEQLRAERERSQQLEQERTQFKQETSQLREELSKLQFQQWEVRMNNESASIKQQYPVLTDAEIHGAKAYMLSQLKNPELPLEQAVMALHGNKIVNSLRNSAKNEVLAEKAGRKRSPLAPQGGKASPTATISDEELFIAKQLGMTGEDYLKYK